MRRVYVGLPAFNEERSIKPLFNKIERLIDEELMDIEVLFYDDGSTDNTHDQVMIWKKNIPLSYINGGTNKGLGSGISELLNAFCNKGASEDILVIMDADDTHDPAQIPHMVQQFDPSPQKMTVIASRFAKGATIAGVPFSRRFLSVGAALAFKMIHNIKGVLDYTCGYRAYSQPQVIALREAYSSSIINEKGFASMVELLLKCAETGGRITEIPLQLGYDRKQSESKMDVSANSFRLLKKLVTWKVRGL